MSCLLKIIPPLSIPRDSLHFATNSCGIVQMRMAPWQDLCFPVSRYFLGSTCEASHWFRKHPKKYALVPWFLDKSTGRKKRSTKKHGSIVSNPETPIFFSQKIWLLHFLIIVFPNHPFPPFRVVEGTATCSTSRRPVFFRFTGPCLWPSRDHEACIRTNSSTGNGATVSHLKAPLMPWKTHTQRTQMDGIMGSHSSDLSYLWICYVYIYIHINTYDICIFHVYIYLVWVKKWWY